MEAVGELQSEHTKPTKIIRDPRYDNPTYVPITESSSISEKEYPYNHFKPTFPDVHWEPLEQFEPPKDRAHFADKSKSSLFGAASKVTDLTVSVGTQLDGIKIRDLNDKQKDELALLVAERGVVFFRDQTDFTIEDQLALGRYFGKLHRHASTATPASGDLPEVHVVYSDGNPKPYRGPLPYSRKELFHSDVSYELQPPCYTSFKVIVTPQTGGDTLWVSGYAAYDRLSYPMREFLEKLTAVHSAYEQAEGSKRAGNPVRRDPIETEHPVVRTHPVTGWKSLYVNAGFTRYIIGVPKDESDAILQFLFNHIATATDFTVRYKWEKDSVAIWDNRVVIHTATYDFVAGGGGRRHALRVTPHGERPYFDPNGKSREEELLKALGIPIERNVVNDRSRGYND